VLFIFLLFSNTAGLLGLRPPTADFGNTLPLGLISFFIIEYYHVRTNTLWEMWEELCHPLPPWLPLWVPINIVSSLARPMSLSLRLFANLLSGVVVMAMVYNMLGSVSYFWPAFLHAALDVLFPVIQAYVFCMLTLSYVISVSGHKEIKHHLEAKKTI
jgi:F-type H+-transporting ATPase subunit a